MVGERSHVAALDNSRNPRSNLRGESTFATSLIQSRHRVDVNPIGKDQAIFILRN